MSGYANRVTGFGGVSPRTSDRLLPDNGAVEATNCKLYSGELVPLRGLGNLYDPTKAGPFNSIFKARNGASQTAWFTWNVDVDCVRVPLATEVESRFCWTGEGVPKMAKYNAAVAGSLENYPVTAAEFMLGIPNPQTAPTVTPSGGSGATVTRYYLYTFFSQDGEETGPSPISLVATSYVNATWAIAAMDPVPTNSGTGTATYSAPSTTFTNGSSVKHWLRVGDTVVINGVDLVVSEIVSPTAFKVPGDYSAYTTWARKVPWNIANMTKRIYRTSGSLGAFQLVVDNLAAATTSYNDTLGDAQILGDELISVGWEPPPLNLIGLMVHPSGALFGFAGNILYGSEPLQPHAWKEKYRWSADADIVGIAGFNTEIVCATKGSPHIASGIEPASMTMDRIHGMYPCLSKRSVISAGDSVLYASQHGLASVGNHGIDIFTKKWVTKEEWRNYYPSTMVCATANGRIYANYTRLDGSASTLVFEDGEMTEISLQANELYTDPAEGTLYIGTVDGVYEWDAPDAYPLSQTWRSKTFYLNSAINLGAAKLDFEQAIDPATAAAIEAERVAAVAYNDALIAVGYGIGGSYGESAYAGGVIIGGDVLRAVIEAPPSNEVTFTLFAKEQMFFSKVINGTEAFKLPANKKYLNYSLQISSQCAVRSVAVAETMSGLKSV